MKHDNAEVVTKERNGLPAMPKSLSLITVVALLALDSFAAAPAPITPTRH